jgi:hypothetical protein
MLLVLLPILVGCTRLTCTGLVQALHRDRSVKGEPMPLTNEDDDNNGDNSGSSFAGIVFVVTVSVAVDAVDGCGSSFSKHFASFGVDS